MSFHHTRVTKNCFEVFDPLNLLWANDGIRVNCVRFAFLEKKKQKQSVWVKKKDSKEASTVFDPLNLFHAPLWASDGILIVSGSHRNRIHSKLYLYRLPKWILSHIQTPSIFLWKCRELLGFHKASNTSTLPLNWPAVQPLTLFSESTPMIFLDISLEVSQIVPIIFTNFF